MSAQLDFLDPPPDPAPVPLSEPIARGKNRNRQAKARELQVAGSRRWIDAGKPIAIAVARKDGNVTAATFRSAADALHQLPNSYNNQRALGWISAMFNELVREGALKKALHPNGAPVRVYGGRNNDHVVYEIAK